MFAFYVIVLKPLQAQYEVKEHQWAEKRKTQREFSKEGSRFSSSGALCDFPPAPRLGCWPWDAKEIRLGYVCGWDTNEAVEKKKNVSGSVGDGIICLSGPRTAPKINCTIVGP